MSSPLPLTSRPQPPDAARVDFSQSPYVAFYEVTQACDLACRHCRACAQVTRHPEELAPHTSLALIGQLAEFTSPPMLVLTGGDPMKRGDLLELVRTGVKHGLHVALTPSATPLVTRDRLATLADAGLSRLAVSLDGADAETHDRFRGVAGSFQRTLEIMADARSLGLPLQVNTTITRGNVTQLAAFAALLAESQIVLWSVFFLVPVGRAQAEDRIAPDAYETVFQQLCEHARRQPFAIKTTEAPHYRRYVLENRRGEPRPERGVRPASERYRTLSTNDGKGILFVGHTGRICPSGFLPLTCGVFPRDSVVNVYQHSPVFRALRNADALDGKCGACEYRAVCGGSRARAYALTGDYLAAEPDCVYQPRGFQPRSGSPTT